eukprot:TRINITY_DN6008_c0_g1_i2.p1 TRINITY_DN6008_c0_g1~~TRINITY_DN6008_c0_g1_i2.p1  ORF type:complete len:623 (+),score=146.43 TRINITY_DN6008_c0_g1_i2:70-1938(+)
MNSSKIKGSIDTTEVDEVALWQQKRLVQTLNKASGQGTSMITIIVPPDTQMARVSKLLTKEYGTASCIKSNITKKSVLEAIRSIQHAAKLFRKPPPNGLAIFCGTVMDGHKQKKQLTLFEPIKPLTRFKYKCDSSFHTEELQDMLQEDDTYGFIVIDGSGTLMATLCGNVVTVQNKYTTSLPKKHKAGGQSAPRFQRLRLNARNTYISKICEQAKDLFISRDSKVLVSGLIVAGLGELKQKLVESKNFEPRLKKKVIKLVDVSYGMNSGLMEAIKHSEDSLSHVKFVKEGRELENFFNKVNESTMNSSTRGYVNGVNETTKALDERVMETLICWEDLNVAKIRLRNKDDADQEKYVYHTLKKNIDVEEVDLTAVIEKEKKKTPDIEWEVEETVSLLDWLVEKYKEFHFRLVLVGDQSDRGSQFVKGFGGIGGILKYEKGLEWFDDAMSGSDDDFWGEGWSSQGSDDEEEEDVDDDADAYRIAKEPKKAKNREAEKSEYADLGGDRDDDFADLGDDNDDDNFGDLGGDNGDDDFADLGGDNDSAPASKASGDVDLDDFADMIAEDLSDAKKEAKVEEKKAVPTILKRPAAAPSKLVAPSSGSKLKLGAGKLSFTGYEFVPKGQ